MKDTIQNHLARLRRNRSRKKKAAAVLVCLSLVVAASVSWSLRMTGESQSAETYCGMEEHSHSEACIQRTLTCGLDESDAYGGHTHSPDYYEERQTLLCQQEEHSHSAESGCFDADGTLTCQAQEHVHGSSCYLSEPVLICGQPETVPAESSGDTGHVHTDACYEVSYTCGFEQEHTHALACYSNPEADVETAADWEQTVSDVQLTGNFAEDLIAIVKTQLGYKESKDNYTVVTDADGEERTKGYTRYGAWYGDTYGDWCAMFVSFCLNYADIPEDVFPRDASCDRWVESLSREDWEMFRPAASYSPYPGDLVFFDTDRDGTADHVGIVSGPTPEYTGTEEYYEDDETYTLTGIKTIEGNFADRVSEREYKLENENILGYAMLPVNNNVIAANDLKKASLEVTLRTAKYANKSYSFDDLSGYSPFDFASSETYSAYEYTEGSQHYYLIPISLLEAAYGDYGFVFDASKACQFDYQTGQNKSYTAGSYEEYGNEWYLKVKCASNDTPVVYYTLLTVADDTVTPSSTVIHMFDYWTTRSRSDSDNHSSNNPTDLNGGINHNHVLKFERDLTNLGAINYSYGGTATPSKATQGIVQNMLGGDGYPVLSGDTSLGMKAEDTYSLGYLFNPYEETGGKESFPRTTGLLSVDSQGYFYYNSAERYAQLDEMTHSFTVYREPAGRNTSISGLKYGQFYPFNDAHEVALLGSKTDPINHYFGMSLTTRFIQQNGGYTDANHSKPTTFEFSGDNDVWIFIDDVLVADLGGLGSSRSVEINFVTGDVTINDGTSDTPNTTIKEAFQSARQTWSNTESNTFADNTTHVLKFFYLERGNYDSNLKFKYNLTEIPPTSIYKIDQYGGAVDGATFAVYPAKVMEGKWFYADGANGTAVVAADALNNPTYDSNWGISYQEITIPAVYYGSTDRNGSMTFVDADEMPLSLDEIKKLCGEHFILREVVVPDGYRTVSDEMYLYIEGGLLQVADLYGTGIWASPNAMITATNTLHVAESSNSVAEGLKDETAVSFDNGTGRYSIKYYDPAQGSNGTLFAVVLKRNAHDNEMKQFKDLKFITWDPLYGNDIQGYNIIANTSDNNLEQVLEAARKQNVLANNVFTERASGMQLLFEDLPGKPERYYSYMVENNITPDSNQDPQYLVAYYWTTGTLADATSTNTVRISSHEGTTPAADSGFDVQWGSTIEVPNMENRLFYQKLDTEGAYINDAVFALYPVGEDNNEYYYIAADGTHIYLEPDTDGDNKGVAYIGTGNRSEAVWSINTDDLSRGTGTLVGYVTGKDAGVITVTADNNMVYTIKPAMRTDGQSLVGMTHPACEYVNEDGTGHFGLLKEGYYILREIVSPNGFAMNAEEIKVIVNTDGVFANAGSAGDGVVVGNGVGYLSKTMDVFASAGSIDESLTWIYSTLKLSEDFTDSTFGGFNLSNMTHYVKQNIDEKDGYGNEITNDLSQAMVTYLRYDPEMDSSLFDYRPTYTQDERIVGKAATYIDENGELQQVTLKTQKPTSTLAGEGTMRLYSEVGWTTLAAYQDCSLGSTLTSGNTYYEDLDGRNIANLFSNSTFVQVTDKSSVDLTVVKTGSDGTEDNHQYLDGAEFTLAKTEGENTYYYNPENNSWVRIEGETAPSLTTATQGDKKSYFTIPGLSDGTYTLTETKSPNENYEITGSPWTIVVGAQTVTVTDADGNQTQAATKLTVNSAPWTEMTDTDPYYNAASHAAQYRMDVVNTYKDAVIDIHVKKVGADAANPADQSPLAGAKFVLYRENAGESTNRTYYIAGTGDGMPTWGARDDATVFESSGAEASFTISSLAAGTYYLMEVEAPAGHSQMTGVIPIVITTTADAAHTTTAALGDGYPNDDVAFDAATNTVTVKNYAGYELPETGGTGTTLFTLGGLLILAATLVYGYGLRRRQERRTR